MNDEPKGVGSEKPAHLRWGARKISDAVIREIIARARDVPRGSRVQLYKDLSIEFHCSSSTVEHIAQGIILPKGTLHDSSDKGKLEVIETMTVGSRKSAVNPAAFGAQAFGKTERASDCIENAGDLLLAQWAKWTRHHSNLGYPRRSVTEKVKEGGITAGSPRPPTALPDDVALTDRAVAVLRNRNRSALWRAIQIRYVDGAPLEALARDMGISRSGAYRLTRRAQRAVYLARENL